MTKENIIEKIGEEKKYEPEKCQHSWYWEDNGKSIHTSQHCKYCDAIRIDGEVFED